VYNRARTRIWAQLKIQRNKGDKYISEIASNFCKSHLGKSHRAEAAGRES
jgi:hypothetical protein